MEPPPAGGVGRVCQPVCAPHPGPAGWAPESPFAQPRGAQPLAGLQSRRMAGTKPPGPLQALYFLSLPSLNPDAHPHPKEATEASQGQPGSPEGCPGPAGPPGQTHGINSQGHTWLTPKNQDAVSSQGAGLQARFQPTSGSGGAGPLRIVHRPTQKPLASPLGGSRHRQTCLRCQSQEMAGLRFTTKLPGPEPRVGLAQRRQWLILWLWKEHSPSAQDVNRPQESPSPQGGSRQEGGP